MSVVRADMRRVMRRFVVVGWGGEDGDGGEGGDEEVEEGGGVHCFLAKN